MKRRSDLYEDAVRRMRDAHIGCKRPSGCTAKKTCKSLVYLAFNGGYMCAGLTWVKKDMDILKVCLRRRGFEKENDIMRLTPPEARELSAILSLSASLFDEYLDPEHHDCKRNMAELRMKSK